MLHNGVPVEIIPWRHDCIADVIEQIGPQLKRYGLKGPFNIQGRLTDDGFRIFEMNTRFTGISGLRARLGFNEVKACIRHWCFGAPMEPPAVNEKLVGVRQVADDAVPVDRNSALGPIVEAMGGRSVQPSKTVLVTGSTGVLGRRLLARIGGWPGHEVVTLDRDRQRAEALHGDTVARFVDWRSATEGALDFGLIDTVVHLGSARPHHGAAALADSVAKMFWLFSRIAEAGVARVIYASSQSIYGAAQPSPWVEALAPAPESAYAQAKFAGEAMLESLSHLYPGLQWTVLRLATLTGSEPEIGQHEALSKIVRSVCRGEELVLQSAAQRLSRLAAGDAAAAVARVLEADHVGNECFNVGTDESMRLAEITDEALAILRAKGFSSSGTVQVENASESVCHQMSSKKFRAAYGWAPAATMRSAIAQIVEREQ